MDIKDVIQKLEALYQNLMSKDLTPDEEAQAKAKLLEILSSAKAVGEVQGGDRSGKIKQQTDSLKEKLLNWDPYGSAWFKEDKSLVNEVYNLLTTLKEVTVEKVAMESGNVALIELNEKVESLASSLRTEIANVKNEMAKIKNSVIALAKAVKEKLESPPAPAQSNNQSTPQASQVSAQLAAAAIKPERSSQPKPIPIPLDLDEEEEPKPISIPKPITLPTGEKKQAAPPQPFRRPRNQHIEIPKPEPLEAASLPKPIPLDEPEPIPIPLSEPVIEGSRSPSQPRPQSNAELQLLGALSSSKKENEKKGGKEQLFSLFSSGEQTSSVDAELELIEELPQQQERSRPKPVVQLPRGSASGLESDSDAETLYQELISLEGKRYSIERNIRDLKSDRENGSITDQEYKAKMSDLLNKLQSISKRIGVIREKLD